MSKGDLIETRQLPKLRMFNYLKTEPKGRSYKTLGANPIDLKTYEKKIGGFSFSKRHETTDFPEYASYKKLSSETQTILYREGVLTRG